MDLILGFVTSCLFFVLGQVYQSRRARQIEQWEREIAHQLHNDHQSFG